MNWHEVPGSKLIRSKLDVLTTSAMMLRDMLCVKACYSTGIWTIAAEVAGLLPREPEGSGSMPGSRG